MYRSFKDMPIWQTAMNVSECIFKLTKPLPKKEDYGLTSQIRRSALSISANIAEAFGRKHVSDKINFYYFARGSIAETQSHLEYGVRVKYFSREETSKMDNQLQQLTKAVNRIVSHLRSEYKNS